MNKLKTSCVAGLMSLLWGIPAVAAETAPGSGSGGERPGLTAGAEVTAMATVMAVDMEKRRITVRRADGSIIDLFAGDEVRNLAQVEVGDRVVVRHKVGLVMMLSPSDGSARERTDRVEFERAELGQKPAGTVRKTVEATGTVVGVDRQARTVTLQGVRHTLTLPVAEDIDIGALEVGDRVDALYEESLAISVEPAPSDE